jgi:pilus assembly protein CpaB
MRSKVIIIVLALVLGGLAAVFAASYLRSARTDIAAGNLPVSVLVATQDLPRGLTAEELVQRKLVEERQVPRQFVSADAISSMRGVENQVLAVPIGAGEQITRTRFAYPQDAGLAYSVPGDLVAISAEVDDVSGVAGLLKPGDYVMVYATLKNVGANQGNRTVVLIPRARVLAAGSQVGVERSDTSTKKSGSLTGSSDRQETSYSTVTLALTTKEAAQLTFAQEEGRTRLALLPAASSKLPVPSTVTLTSVGR